MRFRVVERRGRNPGALPTVLLQRDNWDDYGFKTTFHAELWLADGRKLDLEMVKVLKAGMGDHGWVDIPHAFEALPDDFCSLGQAPSYYEALNALDPSVAAEYLRAMRDVAFSRPIAQRFEAESGFSTSLLRFSSAGLALELGRELFADAGPRLQPGEMVFDFRPPGQAGATRFAFGTVRELPSRMIAIIGYNGSGKTQLLANLGMLAAVDTDESAKEAFVRSNGAFEGDHPSITAAITVSYSAFDNFPVPGAGAFARDEAQGELVREEAGETSARHYTYCGLRSVDESGDVSPNVLKTIDAIIDEFHLARELAAGKLRATQLDLILAPIAAEPSFAMVGELPDVAASRDDWNAAFTRLSTGHKIVLNIVVQLCARLERRSLVLIDEPEQHLHPPLVAALLKAVGNALDQFDSFAVVATHSPVVVQEIPARNVKIMRRSGAHLAIDNPVIETFGENIALLTTHVFNLDNSDRDYQGVLRALAVQYTIDEIEGLFGGALSTQARAIISSTQRAADER